MISVFIFLEKMTNHVTGYIQGHSCPLHTFFYIFLAVVFVF